MQNEIKAGDKVRCKVASYVAIAENQEFIVERSNSDNSLLWFKGFNGGFITKDFEKVAPIGKLIGYTLKKDLPDLKAGALFKRTNEYERFPWLHRAGEDKHQYTDENVAQTDWFEPVYQKPESEVKLASNKVLVIDYGMKRIHLRTGVNNINTRDYISFEQARELYETMTKRNSITWGSVNSFAIQPITTSVVVGCVEVTRAEADNIFSLINS